MTNKISFVLDGKTVSAQDGETIWDVAKREGTIIPHLCHSGEIGYRSDGNCRACMVEVEGERVLTASCIRKPTEGMVINVSGDRPEKARATVLELLLGDQPTHENAHDKSSHLWKTAEAQGIEADHQEDEGRPRGDAFLWRPTAICWLSHGR